jgi:hypothetical protein
MKATLQNDRPLAFGVDLRPTGTNSGRHEIPYFKDSTRNTSARKHLFIQRAHRSNYDRQILPNLPIIPLILLHIVLFNPQPHLHPSISSHRSRSLGNPSKARGGPISLTVSAAEIRCSLFGWRTLNQISFFCIAVKPEAYFSEFSWPSLCYSFGRCSTAKRMAFGSF